MIHRILWFGLCLTIAGCGNDQVRLYPVTGKILFEDGSNARFGSIECRSNTNPPIISRGTINKDGTFELKTNGRQGLTEGQHNMVVVQVIPRNKRKIIHHHGRDVADKYRNYESSGLTINVQPNAKNYYEYTLESK